MRCLIGTPLTADLAVRSIQGLVEGPAERITAFALSGAELESTYLQNSWSTRTDMIPIQEQK